MEKTVYTKNGVAVHSYKNDRISSFTISLFARCGVMYEDKNENGLAHFFEHAVFRSINTLMGGTLYETLDRYGLYFNAATYSSHIEFTVTGATKHFEIAAKIITMALKPLALTKGDRDLEARRIKAEIREEDEGSLTLFADKVVYGGTPLSRPIAGKCSDVDRLGIKLLKKRQTQILSRENIFFFVAGAFPENAHDLLNALIENESICSFKPLSNAPAVPNYFGKRDCAVAVKTSPSTSVSISFDIDRSGYTVPELFYLCDLIFAGESCPMYRVMSEESGLIYSYDENLACYDPYAVISVSFDVKADKLMKSLEIFFGMLRDIRSTLGSRIPLVKASYTDNAARILDDSESIVSAFGYQNHVLGLNARSISERIAAFTDISAERIEDLAKKTFSTDNLVVAIKGTKKNIDTAAIRRVAQNTLDS